MKPVNTHHRNMKATVVSPEPHFINSSVVPRLRLHLRDDRPDDPFPEGHDQSRGPRYCSRRP